MVTAARVLAVGASWRDGQHLEALNHASTGVFMAISALLFLWRGPAIARAGSLLPKIVALIGTWAVVPLIWQPIVWHADVILLASSIGVLLVNLFVIWSVWTLRRSLSIFPEARELVRRGPYGMIRHPLYSAHMASYSLILLPRLAPLAILIAAIGIGCELWRARNEEAVLRSAFPAYDEYAATTPRFVPRPARTPGGSRHE
jgi:protein-S-isoprenylcysteine O-methyltransferase Ste14